MRAHSKLAHKNSCLPRAGRPASRRMADSEIEALYQAARACCEARAVYRALAEAGMLGGEGAFQTRWELDACEIRLETLRDAFQAPAKPHGKTGAAGASMEVLKQTLGSADELKRERSRVARTTALGISEAP